MENVKFSELSYDELVSHVEDAVTALRRRAYYEGYQQGKFDEQMDALMPTTAQAQRDAIVEQAKRDVAELEKSATSGDFLNYCHALKGIGHVNVKFVVNHNKRTVVALLFMRYVPVRKAKLKGIAKCAPTDCFNAHIGKAIALRRALGLEVPAEYLNAPQPTEVRMGDVLKWADSSNGTYMVTGVNRSDDLYRFRLLSNDWESGWLDYKNEYIFDKIIDDTRERDDAEW